MEKCPLITAGIFFCVKDILNKIFINNVLIGGNVIASCYV